MNNTKSVSNEWVYWFLSVDVVCVLVTSLLRYMPHESNIIGYSTFKLLLRQVELGVEMNIGSWWLGLNIFLAALISYEIFSVMEDKRKFSWLILSIVFLGLSVDEVGSIHERVFSSWYVILGVFLVGIIPFAYAIWELFRARESRKSAVLILIGFGVMTLAVPMEYLEHHLTWPSSLVGLRIGFEEGFEVFGALICLVAIVQQRRDLPWSNTLSRVVPNPFLMRGLYSILVGGFLMHIISSIPISLFWKIGARGSPSVYYPSFVFVIVGSSCFWASHYGNVTRKKMWLCRSVVMFYMSLVSFYLILPETTFQYFAFIGGISIVDKISTLWFSYILVLLCILYRNNSVSVLAKYLLVLLFISVFYLSYSVGHQMAYSIAAGIASLLIGLFVLYDYYSVDCDIKMDNDLYKTAFR